MQEIRSIRVLIFFPGSVLSLMLWPLLSAAAVAVPPSRQPVRTMPEIAASGGLGDYNADGIVNLDDYFFWPECQTGPGGGPISLACEVFDADHDEDVDQFDAHALQGTFGENKGVASDSCESPTPLGDGIHSYTNVGATLDGPDEPLVCDFFGVTQIGSDVWFCYTATCSGEAVVSLCGSGYDTKMAVYSGCGCPTVQAMACSDDDCGSSLQLQSRLAFQVKNNQPYMIRIGGFQGAQGIGMINVRCGVDVCGPGNGDCFATAGNGTRGCNDANCCHTVCSLDPSCCDVDWDDFCAAEAEGLCGGHFSTCAPGAGSCADAHVDGLPGCDDVECCNTVCMNDPFCCIDTWDGVCAQDALSACFLTCGGTSGDCHTANGTPGCNDVGCCHAVCSIDPFCCEKDWDQECVDIAQTHCPP